jgi:hypothetical protein
MVIVATPNAGGMKQDFASYQKSTVTSSRGLFRSDISLYTASFSAKLYHYPRAALVAFSVFLMLE